MKNLLLKMLLVCLLLAPWALNAQTNLEKQLVGKWKLVSEDSDMECFKVETTSTDSWGYWFRPGLLCEDISVHSTRPGGYTYTVLGPGEQLQEKAAALYQASSFKIAPVAMISLTPMKQFVETDPDPPVELYVHKLKKNKLQLYVVDYPGVYGIYTLVRTE
ncbi:MAG: hypothetical protein H6581_08350 [Bacteroidia bacterium]|nr:hypothetical protein [Bacteroidia bacterium]